MARATPVHRLLGLQASAGNRAVSRLVSDPSVQRCGGETHAGCPCAEEPVQRADLSEPGLEGASLRQPAESGPGPGAPSGPGAKTLTSPRFVGDATLEACLNDRARLAQGDVSRSTAKIQQALIDLGHDLGPTGADMVYGAKTAAAVRDFKAKETPPPPPPPTHLQLTQGPHLLIERIGGVASRAPGAGTATTAAAFATAFATEGFTLVLTPPAPGAPG